MRWSGCAICWLGLARFGDSTPRDLQQLDSAFRKPTWLYTSERGREENGKRETKGPSDVIEAEPFGECVTNDPRLDLRESRVRFCTLSLHTIFDTFRVILYDKNIF